MSVCEGLRVCARGCEWCLVVSELIGRIGAGLVVHAGPCRLAHASHGAHAATHLRELLLRLSPEYWWLPGAERVEVSKSDGLQDVLV